MIFIFFFNAFLQLKLKTGCLHLDRDVSSVAFAVCIHVRFLLGCAARKMGTASIPCSTTKLLATVEKQFPNVLHKSEGKFYILLS